MSDNPIDNQPHFGIRRSSSELKAIADAAIFEASLSSELRRVRDIIELAIKYKLKHLRVGNVELTLPEPSSPVALPQPDNVLEQVLSEDMPSDEDLAVWSSGGPLPSEVVEAALKAHPGEE